MLSLWYVKREKGWQTFKRPGVDAFLEHLAQFYEIVIYSDEQSMVIGLFTPYSWSSIFSSLYFLSLSCFLLVCAVCRPCC